MPAWQEAAERGLLDRLDLAAERGQRRAPQSAQDLGVAPLALGPAGAQVAPTAQQVVQLVRGPRLAAEPLLYVGQRAWVDQVAQLFLPEQLLEEVPVERERLRAALGGGRVVLVHVVRDVVEEQRGRV